jgi:ankyrin repeat protein
LLISKGARTDSQNREGDTPLHWAAFAGATQATKILLALGANSELTNKQGRTPSAEAKKRNFYELAILLKRHSQNI